GAGGEHLVVPVVPRAVVGAGDDANAIVGRLLLLGVRDIQPPVVVEVGHARLVDVGDVDVDLVLDPGAVLAIDRGFVPAHTDGRRGVEVVGLLVLRRDEVLASVVVDVGGVIGQP